MQLSTGASTAACKQKKTENQDVATVASLRHYQAKMGKKSNIAELSNENYVAFDNRALLASFPIFHIRITITIS